MSSNRNFDRGQLTQNENVSIQINSDLPSETMDDDEDRSKFKSNFSKLSTRSLPDKIDSASYYSPLSSMDNSKVDIYKINYNNNNNNNNNNNLYETKLSNNGKHSKYIEISRNILNLSTLTQFADEKSSETEEELAVKKYLFQCECSPIECIKSYVPIIDWLPKYSFKNFYADFFAGITVSVLHIPQGIAYSMLAGLHPVHGLYVSFFPVLIYAIMGTSPHISLGTFAVVAMMLNNIAQKNGASINGSNFTNVTMSNETAFWPTIDNHTTVSSSLSAATSTGIIGNQHSLTYLEVLTSVCLLCGLIQISMSLLRLGSLSLILSEQLVSSFSTAVSIHVATSQLIPLFGFVNLSLAKSGPFKLIKSWIRMSQHLADINVHCLTFSILTIAVLILSKELVEPKLKKRFGTFPLPIDLILVIASILLSWTFQFNHEFNIQVVKIVPTGLPKPTVPRFDLWPNIFLDSLIVACICFAVSLSLAKIFAKKHNDHIRPNQELLALGTANLFSSFFLCFPSSAALSRSTLQEKIGGRTQIAGIISSFIILTVLLFLAPFLYHLPKFTLSCIVLVALKTMFMQILDFRTFWHTSKLDGIAWIITFLSVVILDIDYGLIIGICTAILVILIRLSYPKISVLGHLLSTEIYLEREHFNNIAEYPGLKIVRVCSPLFYLNADSFKEKIINICQREIFNSEPRMCAASRKALILDLGGLSFIDKTGLDVLIYIVQILQQNQIYTCLTNCSSDLIETFRKVNFTNCVQHKQFQCNIYPTIHDAMIDLY